MIIPRTLIIGAHRYKVEQVTPSGLDSDKIGSLDRSKGILYLDATMPQSEREAALFHEALHGMNSELDHALLDSLSEQIYAFLKVNRLLR